MSVPEAMREQVTRLVEQAQFDGVQLTGGGGLLPDMIRHAVEAVLQGEMTAHQTLDRRRRLVHQECGLLDDKPTAAA